MTVRSTADVFDDHLRRALAGDTEGDIALNYAQNVVLLTGIGILRGHEGVRRSRAVLAADVPSARISVLTCLVEGDHAFLEWLAVAEQVRVDDGADGFTIRDGRIVAQTIHYTVHHRAGYHEPLGRHEGTGSARPGSGP